jgi:hypothetical protein
MVNTIEAVEHAVNALVAKDVFPSKCKLSQDTLNAIVSSFGSVIKPSEDAVVSYNGTLTFIVDNTLPFGEAVFE